MNLQMMLPVALIAAGCSTVVSAQESTPIRVTVDNFKQAETDNYFSKFAKDGGFGKIAHERGLAPIDKQTVIRMNRDTLYSFGVFDLEAGDVTVTLPDAGKRFLSVQLINEEHYAIDVLYAPGAHTLTKAKIGMRYVCLAIRIFVDPNSEADVKIVHALQDAIKTEQKSTGSLVVPNWDQGSLTKVREALLGVVAANGALDSARMFGRKDQVDPVQHLLGTAAGWGGNPKTAAMYVGGTPAKNDGKTVYRLTLKDVPVDGFWSVSVYNKAGFFEKNPQNAYTLNNITAKPSADGSFTIQFGGDVNTPNMLPIMPGWNYLLRLYRPRQEILDGKWQAPEPQIVK